MKIYTSVNGKAKEPDYVYVPYNGEALKIYTHGPVTGTYTVRLNLNDSNPETWGEYQDNCVGMTPGDDAFDTFFGHYPCILEDGVELGRLQRDDFTKYKDGSAAPITTLGKDVMTYFPRRGLKIWEADGYLYVSITANEKDVDGYGYYAFTYKAQVCDGFYRGCYKGYVNNGKLYSTSGQTPTGKVTIGNFRNYVRARGTNYEQSAFYQLTYLQAMYLIKYRGQNAQIALGRGFVDENNSRHITGGTNTFGMDYGETTGKVQCKLFGQEDFYGNTWEFIDGIWSNASRQLSASDGDYNDTGSGYTAITTKTSSSSYAGYMKTALGTTEGGFAPDVSTIGTYGSATTYWCDNAFVGASLIAYFGGSNASFTGVFNLNMSMTASSTGDFLGARLMYFKVRA